MNHPVAFLPTAADPTKGIDQAFQETLELLEWPRVCDHLASFASTRMGRDAARNLVLPETLEASRQRLGGAGEKGGKGEEGGVAKGEQAGRRAGAGG